jgi:hypothetical protein
MTQFAILLIWLMGYNMSYAQTTNDTIHPVNLVRIAGLYHNELVEKGDIKRIIIQNSNARKKVRTHNAYIVPSTVFLCVGIGATFVPVFQAVTQQKISLEPIPVIGGGFILFFVFKTIANNKFKTGVNIYNYELSKPRVSNHKKTPIEIYSNGNDISLKIQF